MVAPSVEHVNHEADHHPNDQSNPGVCRKRDHQCHRTDDAHRCREPDARRLERPLDLGLSDPQDEDTRRDHRESEEGADRGELARDADGNGPAAIITITPVMIVVIQGVRNRG